MKLSKSYETYFRDRGGILQSHVIEIKTNIEVLSKEEAGDLNYDNFDANLIINGKFVADISKLLSRSDAFVGMIDETDWAEMWAEAMDDIKHYQGTE